MSRPKPHLQAFLIADHVYKDQYSNKAIVAGIFDNVNGSTLPVVFPGSFAYARLVGAPSQFSVMLRLIDLSDLQEVANSGEFQAQNKKGALGHTELIIQIPPIQFRKFGAFEFELVIDGHPLKGMRLTVVKVAEGGAQ